MFKKSDWKPLVLGCVVGMLLFFGATVEADEITEQFEPVDIPENMYFIFGMYMSGESKPVPQIFGPGTVEECKSMQKWWQDYADELVDKNSRTVYLMADCMADCMAEDKLKMKSI